MEALQRVQASPPDEAGKLASRPVRRPLLVVVALLAAGCRWHAIPWEPRDPERVAALRAAVLADHDPAQPDSAQARIEAELARDPLSVVPDQRFRSAFSQLDPGDRRLDACPRSFTAGGLASLEFTPEETSATEARRKFVRCTRDEKSRVSHCRFASEKGYHLPGSDQVFGVGDGVEIPQAIGLMTLLAAGRWRSEIPDDPTPGWPASWGAQHAGRKLVRTPEPDRYELTLPGCGCSQVLLIEYGSPRASDQVILLDFQRFCV
jgi:hypothetical protein